MVKRELLHASPISGQKARKRPFKTRKAIVERFSAVELPPTQIDVRIKRDPTKVRVLPTDGCSWVSTPASASP